MKKILLLLIVFVLILSGCSNGTAKPDNNTSEVAKSNTEGPKKVVEDDTENTDESEIGKLTIVNKNKSVGAVQESGPFTVKLNQMQVASLEVSEDYKSMFDDKDVVTVVTLEIEVENNSTDTNTIYPDQATIVTNTKEQKQSDLFLSDSVGGEYIGEVIKKGNVIFLLDSDAKEVTSFKYIISAPTNDDWDKLGEDITFELNF